MGRELDDSLPTEGKFNHQYHFKITRLVLEWRAKQHFYYNHMTPSRCSQNLWSH